MGKEIYVDFFGILEDVTYDRLDREPSTYMYLYL